LHFWNNHGQNEKKKIKVMASQFMQKTIAITFYNICFLKMMPISKVRNGGVGIQV